MTETRPVLCLWGFMGTGKTTVGALVAEKTGARFVDLDALAEERAGKPIRAIFADDGEPSFRALERDLLQEMLELSEPTVVALGGGTLVAPTSRELAKQAAFVVTLTASADAVLKRTATNDERPLLDGNRRAAIKTLLEARSAAYEDTHLAIDTEGRTPEQVADDLSKRWNPR
jgi:shikimate kinase